MRVSQDRRAGLSLIELLVGLLAAAVLALTAGSMLWYGYLGWHRTGEAVGLQRDSRTAMDVLTRALRSGTNMTFSTGMVFTVWYADKPAASVYAAGRDLFYQPNIAAGGNTMKLIAGTLDRFNVGLGSGTSSVLLVVSTSTSSISNRVVVSRRN
jgi:Tfp pilus assembly protein PilW